MSSSNNSIPTLQKKTVLPEDGHYSSQAALESTTTTASSNMKKNRDGTVDHDKTIAIICDTTTGPKNKNSDQGKSAATTTEDSPAGVGMGGSSDTMPLAMTSATTMMSQVRKGVENLHLNDTEDDCSGVIPRHVPGLFCLPTDIAVRDIFLPHLKPSQRLPLFSIPTFCRRFALEDHFCGKHGQAYLNGADAAGDDRYFNEDGNEDIFGSPSPYDMEPRQDQDPQRRNDNEQIGHGNGGEDEEGSVADASSMGGRELMSKILNEMEQEGKEIHVFRAKLAKRTAPFPVEQWEDENVNLPETPLKQDVEFGEYFRRMKKCESCECEARARQNAKRGVLGCQHCHEYYQLVDGLVCIKCNHRHGCEQCAYDIDDVFVCDRCDFVFCSNDRNCGREMSCEQCDRTACEDCQRDGEFLVCKYCDTTLCDECGAFRCEMCSGEFCFNCQPGGYRDCCNATFCTSCKDCNFCDACQDRSCSGCMSIPESCDRCDMFWCDDCGGMFQCGKCGECYCDDCGDGVTCRDCGKTFCVGCWSRPSFAELGHCCQCDQDFCLESCRDMEICDGCEQRTCSACSVTCEQCCYSSCESCLGKSKEECTKCTFCGASLDEEKSATEDKGDISKPTGK